MSCPLSVAVSCCNPSGVFPVVSQVQVWNCQTSKWEFCLQAAERAQCIPHGAVKLDIKCYFCYYVLPLSDKQACYAGQRKSSVIHRLFCLACINWRDPFLFFGEKCTGPPLSDMPRAVGKVAASRVRGEQGLGRCLYLPLIVAYFRLAS